jgi:hypothetical protein
MIVDLPFLLAVGAFGWGLSLVTYRSIARLSGWPLGVAQQAVPALTVVTGAVCVAIAVIYALAIGLLHGGAVILTFGVGLAIFWSGFLRVGSQSALLLAPLSTVLLLASRLLSAIGYI